MGKKMPPKMWNESVVAIFHSEISPIVSRPFREKERLECKIRVNFGYYSAFIDIIHINYTRSYVI